jgi:predicted DNA-binding ribbon-helix-helix protein
MTGRTIKPTRLINRNVTSSVGRTSIRMEPEFWAVLDGEAARTGKPIGYFTKLISEADPSRPLTGALRVWLLQLATESRGRASR